jgi:hypothetical protein
MDGSGKRVCIHSYDLCVIEYIIHFFYPAEEEVHYAYLLSCDKKFVFYR